MSKLSPRVVSVGTLYRSLKGSREVSKGVAGRWFVSVGTLCTVPEVRPRGVEGVDELCFVSIVIAMSGREGCREVAKVLLSCGSKQS